MKSQFASPADEMARNHQPTTMGLLRLILLQALLLHIHIASGSEVGTSPQITTQPQDTIAAPSSSATLQCGASGTPQPSIAWFNINDETQVGTGEQLQISASGDYYCVASNAVGSVRSLSVSVEIAFLGAVSGGSFRPTVGDNQPITLDCELPASLPPAAVSWTRGSTVIDGSDPRLGIITLAGSLVISYTKPVEDTGGEFACTVENEFLSRTESGPTYTLDIDRSNFQSFVAVEFIAEPAVLQPPTVGDTVTLECFTTGSPAAAISWQKDGSPVSSSARVSLGQANRVLTISEVEEGDAGSYTCIATQTTNAGPSTIQASTELTVIVPPTITQSFPETSVFVSQLAVLTCRAEGSGPFEWTWRKDGSQVVPSGRVGISQSGDSSSLSFTSVTEEDGGVYQCVVEGRGGEAAANELLVPMILPPSFTHGNALRDQLVLTGSTVLLPCLAEGFPPPLFTWTIGNTVTVDTELEAFSRYSLPPAGTNNGSLSITNVVIGDTGIYVCTASSLQVSIDSNAVQLRVIAPPSIVSSPSPAIPPTGSTLTLDCEVSVPSFVTVRYVWMKDHAPLELTNGVSVASDSGDLTLTNVDDDNNGVYECTVELTVTGVEAGPVVVLVNNSVILTVDDPPMAPSPPLNPSLSSPTSTSITLQWNPPQTNGGLQILNYTIEFQELGRPSCPQTDPEWIRVDTEVPNSMLSFEVDVLSPFTMYRFRVIAFNTGDMESEPSEETDVVQTLEAAPSAPPTSVTVETRNEEELMVSWQPPSPCTTHNGILVGYSIQFQESSGSNSYTERPVGNTTSYLLTGLVAMTTYDVRVAARTMTGAGPFSAEENGTTAAEPTAPPSAPTDVTVQLINATTALITWGPPMEGSSTVTGYVIRYTGAEGETMSLTLGPEERSVIISGLQPGVRYSFSLAAQNGHGLGAPVNSTVTVPPVTEPVTPDESEKQIFEEVWFIAVVAVGGTLLVVVVVITVFCLCYKINSQDGKIYIVSRRSASSLSGASSGFSEFQHKRNKVMSHIKVHGSPTPSRRTAADYADLESVRSLRSQQPPSIGYADSIVSTGTEGHVTPQYHSRTVVPERYTPNSHSQVTHPGGYSHLHPHTHTHAARGNLPPPPPFSAPKEYHFSTSASNPVLPTKGITLSQDSDDSWSPADNLNYRGHMSNREPVSRSNSMLSNTSAESRGPATNIPSGLTRSLEQRGHIAGLDYSRQSSLQSSRSQLPPLHENLAMEGGEARDSRVQGHRMPPQARVPTHLLPHSGPHSGGSISPGEFQFHSQILDPRTGMEHGRQQPSPSLGPGSSMPGMEQRHQQALPQTHIFTSQIEYRRPPSPAVSDHGYAEVPFSNPTGQRFDGQFPDRSFTQPTSTHIPPTYSLPKHSPPIPRVSSQYDLPNAPTTYPIFMPDGSYPNPHSMHGLEQSPPPYPGPQQPNVNPHLPAHHQSLQQVTHHISYPQAPTVNSMHNLQQRDFQNRPQPYIQPSPTLPPHHQSLQQVASTGEHYQTPTRQAFEKVHSSMSLQEQHWFQKNTLNSVHQPAPIHMPHTNSLQQQWKGKVETQSIPDVVQNSTGPQYTAVKTDAPVPDLRELSRDSRRPKPKKVKVRGQVWEPMPMNRAVQSGSSESESESSEDSSLDLDVPDNTSLKSSYV